LAEITRRDIAALLADIEAASGPYARNHVRASLSSLWAWAIAEGLAEASPVTGTLRAEETSRDRVLADTELAQIWRSLPVGDFGDIMRLLFLTGQRREEIAGLQWSEVNLTDRVITLPPARTKNKRPHTVPLSEPALAILAARRPEGPAVFGRDGRDRFINWSNTKAALDRRLPGLPQWRVHDARRTVATGLQHLGIPPHICECVLNHIGGFRAGVGGVYLRATYEPEKRDALERWAKHIGEIVAVPASIGTTVAAA
jgi:integrase